jgi:O-methyltransferase
MRTSVRADNLPAAYLDIMKRCLTRTLFDDLYEPVPRGLRQGRVFRVLDSAPIRGALEKRGLAVARKFDMREREIGKDWPGSAETMVGLRRLENLQRCIEQIVADEIPGDLIETGVWRGGSSIFMRAALLAYGDDQRRVWLADSFRGLPEPDPSRYPADEGDRFHTFSELAVSAAEVRRNFERYGLLDERVCFLEGWFRDTLPAAPIERLSLLRLDGDMYESTIDPLRYLYHKVSPGGYVIVDDYEVVEACKKAVDDFRAEHEITEEIAPIDGTGVFWRKV